MDRRLLMKHLLAVFATLAHWPSRLVGAPGTARAQDPPAGVVGMRIPIRVRVYLSPGSKGLRLGPEEPAFLQAIDDEREGLRWIYVRATH